MSVVIETTIGDITVDLFLEERPSTCNNFLKLCKVKYYNYSTFHFVQRDFIAQTGDPTGTGTGGESVYVRVFGDKGRFIEAEKKPKIKHDRFGLISMVNNGENLHGSQFFFTLCHSLDYLDGVHTVFGQVVEGEDVLLQLNDTICDENNRPYQDIMITHTVVLDDPFPDVKGLKIPDQSPTYQLEDLLQSDRIGIGENILNDEKPIEVIEEEIKDKDAKQRALVLEMIGDIPDADIAPPENVLFVCKLNPVTREEDLEIIFSRFGQINGCEIIKDEQTGDSLQYGFIEFDKKEDCEQAYFKMDNVLIDDRRIHVDFSQSVSKIKWRGKGRGVTYHNDKDEVEHHSRSGGKDFRNQTMNYIRSIENNPHRSKDSSRNHHRSARRSPEDRRHRDRKERSDRSRHRRDQSDSRERRHWQSGSPDRSSHHKRKRDDYSDHRRKSSKHYNDHDKSSTERQHRKHR